MNLASGSDQDNDREDDKYTDCIVYSIKDTALSSDTRYGKKCCKDD